MGSGLLKWMSGFKWVLLCVSFWAQAILPGWQLSITLMSRTQIIQTSLDKSLFNGRFSIKGIQKACIRGQLWTEEKLQAAIEWLEMPISDRYCKAWETFGSNGKNIATGENVPILKYSTYLRQNRFDFFLQILFMHWSVYFRCWAILLPRHLLYQTIGKKKI